MKDKSFTRKFASALHPQTCKPFMALAFMTLAFMTLAFMAIDNKAAQK